LAVNGNQIVGRKKSEREDIFVF